MNRKSVSKIKSDKDALGMKSNRYCFKAQVPKSLSKSSRQESPYEYEPIRLERVKSVR